MKQNLPLLDLYLVSGNTKKSIYLYGIWTVKVGTAHCCLAFPCLTFNSFSIHFLLLWICWKATLPYTGLMSDSLCCWCSYHHLAYETRVSSGCAVLSCAPPFGENGLCSKDNGNRNHKMEALMTTAFAVWGNTSWNNSDIDWRNHIVLMSPLCHLTLTDQTSGWSSKFLATATCHFKCQSKITSKNVMFRQNPCLSLWINILDFLNLLLFLQDCIIYNDIIKNLCGLNGCMKSSSKWVHTYY